MSDPNVPQAPDDPVEVTAAEVVAGDRIAAATVLPFPLPSDVLFVYAYAHHGRDWVMVVHRYDGCAEPDLDFFLAGKVIPLERRAADLHEGRTTAVAEAKPDTLVQPLGRAAEEALPSIEDDPVAKRLGIVRCCDLHGSNCEPPSELCCRYCTEANHPDHPNVDCVLRQGGQS